MQTKNYMKCVEVVRNITDNRFNAAARRPGPKIIYADFDGFRAVQDTFIVVFAIFRNKVYTNKSAIVYKFEEVINMLIISMREKKRQVAARRRVWTGRQVFAPQARRLMIATPLWSLQQRQ